MKKSLIFLTMSRVEDISVRDIYSDLLKEFFDNGYDVYIVTPFERHLRRQTEYFESEGVHILGVRTLNLKNTSIFEKGLGQLFVEYQYRLAIRKYLKKVSFDLILYSTPPITFSRVVSYLKKENPRAVAYLLLKDIFPQNAVDIGLISKYGLRKVIYDFYRRKEKALYRVSDYIGCMSPANVEYIISHNSDVLPSIVEVAPNSIRLREGKTMNNRAEIRAKYGLPNDKLVFVYGGNLGKPQGIPYLIKCLEANIKREDCHFLIVGSGTELQLLFAWYNDKCPTNVTIMKGLPKSDYDSLVAACDVGMIFLDHRFTIPNFPSRLLSYLENKMPVLCATDPNTDLGRIVSDNGFGYWCNSNSVDAFSSVLNKMTLSDLASMGQKGYEYLRTNYTVEKTYNTIVSHV